MDEYNWDSIFAVHEYFSKAQISINHLNKIWFSNYDPFYSGPLTCFGIYENITGHFFKQNILPDEKSLADIKYLFLTELGLEDISPIKKLYNLEVISCSCNDIDSVVPLRNLKQLRELDFDKNKINNLAPLSDLANLEVLKLMDNQITNISQLFRLANLKELDLAGNKIQDLLGLSVLKNLQNLDLSYNEITNVSALRNLQQLNVLRLNGNHIQIDKIVDLAKIIRNCKIYIDYQGIDYNFNPENGYLYLKAVDSVEVPFFVNYKDRGTAVHTIVALLDKTFIAKKGIVEHMKFISRDIVNSFNRSQTHIRENKREHFFEETSHFVRGQFDY